MDKIVRRKDGSFTFVTKEYELQDGEAFVSPDSPEGVKFLEDEVDRLERDDRATKAVQAIEERRRAAAVSGRRSVPAGGDAPQNKGTGTAVLDGGRSDDGDGDKPKEPARFGLGLDVYAKMTDGEARGGTKHFAEFIRKLRFDATYAEERRKATRRLYPDLEEKTLAEGSTSAGGALVPPQYIQELLDIVRAEAVAFQAGVQLRTIGTNLAYLPTLTTASTASWIAENGAITPSDQVFGQQSVSISKLGGGTKVSNELIADSDPSIMEVVQQDLAKVIALKLDLGIFQGTGSSPEIRGFANTSGTTAPALTTAIGANGRTPTIDDFMDLAYTLQAVNITDSDRWSMVAHPRLINTLRKLKDTTNNYLLLNQGGAVAPGTQAALRPNLLGVPLYMSSQLSITTTLGTSTDTTSVYFGRFYESMVFVNGGFTIDMSQEAADATNSAFWSDQTWIRAKQRVGFLVRRPAGMVVFSGVRP